MPDLDCVTETDLRAFQLGEVPARIAARILGHLDACPACAALADRLDTIVDPCIVRLREAAGQATPQQDMLQAATESGSDGSASMSTIDAALPRRFGSYELLEELGRGGMSVVYLATQERPARMVALKLILAGVHAGVERRTRFLAEADAIGRLQHPNIVQIYEVGEYEGQLFLSLEYIDGGNLAKLLNGKPQDPATSALLIEKLARTIQYAHENGVIHRDLKPSNILLQRSQTDPGASPAVAKIADFGLAKQDDVNLTATNAMLGTPVVYGARAGGGR
jgi:serine/threonine protein kinase